MKLLIFGSVASGKTTLARQLSEKYNVPFYEGDGIAYGFEGEENKKRSTEEQLMRIQRIDEKGEWIIEGTYRESQRCLFDMAEKIIFLDTSLLTRYIRIITRFVKQRLGTEKCRYKPTWKVLKYMFIWTKEFEGKRDYFEELLAEQRDKVVRVTKVKQLE